MSSILSSGLFEKALVEPLENDANKLCIVSGYATATMAIRHIEYAKRIKKNLSIELIVGMCSQDGIERKNHNAFIELQSAKYEVDFKCLYVVNRPPIHSKVYAWLKNSVPVSGFVGSANYTQNAFSDSMREVLCLENPNDCFDYFKSVRGEALNCDNSSIPDYIDIFDRKITIKSGATEITSEAETASSMVPDITGLPSITLSLLEKRTGEVPARSGLNWGQRPEEGREPNQAYINIPADIGRSGFFPDRYQVFTVSTDDGKQLICVRAQDGGKGLHTTLNNSHLGEYFRYRLGLPNGAFIRAEDLLKYGRTDVTFYKIDDENYLMDFSVR